VNANNISLTGQSAATTEPSSLFAGTQGAANAGGIELNPFTGGSDLNVTFAGNTQISTTTSGAGTGGDITVGATTSGAGTGGDITVGAPGTVRLQGLGSILAETEGSGNAGTIALNATNLLTVSDGASISAQTTGVAPGGDITLTGPNITVTGSDTQINANTDTLETTGIGGAIALTLSNPNTNSLLTVSDGALITASTSGMADGGRIALDGGVGTIHFDDGTASVETSGAGNGGALTLTAGTIELRNNSLIRAETRGSGAAGNITIGQVTFDENGSFDRRGSTEAITINSTIITTEAVADASGLSGDINLLAAGNINLTNSNITSDSNNDSSEWSTIWIESTGGSTFLSNTRISASNGGTGYAGAVLINADDEIRLTDDSEVSTDGDIGWLYVGYSVLPDNTDRSPNNASSPQAINLTDSSLTATYEISGGNGTSGDIRILSGDTLSVTGSTISASATESSNSGQLIIDAQDVLLQNQSFIESRTISGTGRNISFRNLRDLTIDNSEIAASTQSGTAGSVRINDNGTAANLVRLQQGGRVAAEATEDDPSSRAGNITINAQIIELEDDSRIVTRNVASAVLENQQGQFGNIELSNVDNLSLSNSLLISATESGNAGSISVNGDVNSTEITISGVTGDLNRDGAIDRLDAEGIGGIIAAATNGGSAGNITLATRDLTIEQGAQITAQSEDTDAVSTGTAGTIDITASGDVNLTDAEISTNNESARAPNVGEDFGNIRIQRTTRLSATNSLITASTESGTAGNIRVNARERVQLSGQVEASNSLGNNEGAGGLRVEATNGGTAGNIRITTPLLIIEDGAAATVSSSSGVAGNFIADAQVVILDNGQITALTGSRPTDNSRSARIRLLGLGALRMENGSEISATAQGNANGGTIFINITDGLDTINPTNDTRAFIDTESDVGILLMETGSLISAQARGSANGGNITINIPGGYLIGTPLGNNDIIATANIGNGGNITIDANRIFGLTNRSRTDFTSDQLRNNNTSDISANSRSGTEGTISFNVLNIDPTRGLVTLPETGIDATAEVARRCGGAIEDGDELGQFIITGRGGLPPTPDDLLGATTSAPDLITLDTPDTLSSNRTVASTAPTPIIEAQGWAIAPDGQVILTAHEEGNPPATLTPITCTSGS